MESQLWHGDTCRQNGDEHVEDACSRMVVSHCAAGMNMLEGGEPQTKTLQDKFNKLQDKLNKVNASKRQATAAAHHCQKACLAKRAQNNQLTQEINQLNK